MNKNYYLSKICIRFWMYNMLGRRFRVFIWFWEKITQNTDETLQWKKQNRILLARVQALQQIQDCFRPGQHNRTLQNISGQESRNAFGQLQSRNIFSTGDKKKTRIAFSLANFLTIKRSKYCFRPGKNRIQSISGFANTKVEDCLRLGESPVQECC